jgi:hypothetical protein
VRGLAALWVATALVATALLGTAAIDPGPLPEIGHLAGHLLLCGGLAWMVATFTGSSAGPAVALAAATAFGAAIELVQILTAPPTWNTLFDLGMDLLGATLGVGAWAAMDRERHEPVGHLISAALHPLWIAPVGFFALAAVRQGARDGLWWTMGAAVAMAPAVAAWAVGIARGWWVDADLSRRDQRPPLFAAGVAGVVALALVARGTSMATSSGLVALGAGIGTAMTVAGWKISGHVAIPAALGLLLAPSAPKEGGWFLAAAAVLAVARVAAGRHHRAEVAAGAALAVLIGLLSLA